MRQFEAVDAPVTVSLPQEEAPPQRETRILRAAGELFAHFGYDKTTVSEIAERAGISKGAIYLHFRSKEDLLDALLAYEGENLAQEMLSRIAADPDGVSLRTIYRHSLLTLADNPLLSALFTRDSRILGEHMHRQGGALNERQYALTLVFVEKLQQAGLIRDDLNPRMGAFLLTMISIGLLMAEQVVPSDHVPSLEEVAEALAEFMQRALGSQQPGDSSAGWQALLDYHRAVEAYNCGPDGPAGGETTST